MSRSRELADEERELKEKSKSKSVVVEPPSEVPEMLEDEVPEDPPPPVDSIFEELEGELEIAVPYSVSNAATVPQTSPSLLNYVGKPCRFSVHSPCLHAPQLISLQIIITVASDVP